MYEVFIKSWYQELTNNGIKDGIQEEVFFESQYIEDASSFLTEKIAYFIEYHAIIEIGIRLKKQINAPNN